MPTPRIAPGGGTPPELAGEHACGTALLVEAATDVGARMKLDHPTANSRLGIRQGDASKANVQANLTTMLGGIDDCTGTAAEDARRSNQPENGD